MKMAALAVIFFCRKLNKKYKKYLFFKYFVYLCIPINMAPLQLCDWESVN